MRQKNRSPTAVTFRSLAERASLHNRTDPAFLELRETLQGWFPTPDGESNRAAWEMVCLNKADRECRQGAEFVRC